MENDLKVNGFQISKWSGKWAEYRPISFELEEKL
jgi:hypothetical protein